MLDSKIDELEGEVEKICQTLDTSRQSMWAMLVSSTCQKLDYWLLRLPVSLGGLVIRSTLETRHAAFIGGVEQALPYFTNERESVIS